jgi:hypothetical protein
MNGKLQKTIQVNRNNIFLKLSIEFIDQEHGALNFTSTGLWSSEIIFN